MAVALSLALALCSQTQAAKHGVKHPTKSANAKQENLGKAGATKPEQKGAQSHRTMAFRAPSGQTGGKQASYWPLHWGGGPGPRFK
jgi:hypothetical protein